MRKVKLVFVKAYLDIPTFKDTFSCDVEVQSPSDIEDFRLIGARIYERETAAQNIGGDTNTMVLEYADEQNLLGKLLTYIDATYTDQEQRKAHKDIVRQVVNNWRQDIHTRGVQTVDSQEAATAYQGTINK